MSEPAEKIRKGEARRQRGNRTGLTTGACCAAAAKAATLGLLCGEVPMKVAIRLPNGQEAAFDLIEGSLQGEGAARVAHAVIVKDGGDDPDATHGAHMTAEVRLPQRNIRDNVRAAGGELLAQDGLEITFSVPDGEERAKRTLNARLGILGGISILGTTGIVRPYSTAAFRASVVQAVDVAAHQGQSRVVFTTGGRTEKFAMRQLPELDESCFVQMGDFVKAAFTAAIRCRMTHIHVGAMVGKLTKMGQGLSVTHAWKAEIDRDLLADAARAVGAPDDLVEEIRQAETARFAAERLAQLGLTVPYHRHLAIQAIRSLKGKYPGTGECQYHLTVLVCDFEGQFICRVEEEEAFSCSLP